MVKATENAFDTTKATDTKASDADGRDLKSGGDGGEQVRLLVGKDVGLRQFLRRTLGASSLGIMGGLTTAQAIGWSGLLMDKPLWLVGGGFFMSVAGILGVTNSRCIASQQIIDGTTVYSSRNPLLRKLAFGLISAGMGVTMAPLTAIAQMVDPFIFPAATVLSLTTMGGCVAYAMRQPNESLIRLRGPLFGALTGMVGLGFLAIGAAAFIGPNAFTAVWTNIDIYGGLILFTGITAYDVHQAVQRYQSGNADHLLTAVEFYLDFCNFFIRFLHILLKARQTINDDGDDV